ncbi:MAG: HD domain-containing protein [Candidatus Bathyarchaeota archaeon]|nr:HD domain-containing protein [Candidatus Bathyarchaeota archaeon]
MKPKALLEFLSFAGKLKTIPRTGWIDSGVKEPESVADHSYRTAVAAMVLGDSLGLDTLKVLRMALLHDIAETETGDITPMQKQSNHSELEDQAMKKLLSVLPETLRDLYWGTWLEYQAMETPESILMHDADKIEMVLQASEYKQTDPDAELDRFYHAMVSPSMKKIVEKIKERN